MPRYALLLLIPLVLTGCGGPLSMVSYALGAGVMMHANDEALKDAQNARYTDRCMPTHRKENLIISGNIKEAQGELIMAYEFYRIAEKLGYAAAPASLAKLRATITEKQRTDAEENMKKYSDIHISSCFYSEKTPSQ